MTLTKQMSLMQFCDRESAKSVKLVVGKNVAYSQLLACIDITY